MYPFRAVLILDAAKAGGMRKVPTKAMESNCGDGLLDALLETTPDVIFVRDLEGRYVLLNAAAARAKGLTVPDLLGKTDDELSTPEVLREQRDQDRRTISEGRSRTFEQLTVVEGEERVRQVTTGPCRDRDGCVRGVFVISRDVTDDRRAKSTRAALLECELEGRRQAEWARSVAESAARTLHSLENITEAALVSLDTTEVLDALMAAIRDAFTVDTVTALLLDESANELVLRAAIGFDGALTAGARFPAHGGALGGILSGHGPLVVDDLLGAEFQSPHLQARGVRSMLGTPLRTADRVIGVLDVGSFAPRHFTEAEASLLQLAADRVAIAAEHAGLYESARRATRTRDKVLGIVAHDLRSPLSGIMLSASALRRSSGSKSAGPGHEQPVDLILGSARRMNRLIEDLLDVTRIESGRLGLSRTSVDIVPLLTEAIDLATPLASAKSIHLEARLPPDLPAVDADRHRILQVFANLLGNAIKFAPDASTVLVAAEPEGATVRFSVMDSGPGIAEQDLPRVFDRFWSGSSQNDRSSAGLGLSIARGIVERHGGHIDVLSTLGTGSTFRFTLPIVALGG